MIYRYLALLSVLYLVTKVVKNPLKAKEMEFFLLLKDTAQNRADYGFAQAATDSCSCRVDGLFDGFPARRFLRARAGGFLGFGLLFLLGLLGLALLFLFGFFLEAFLLLLLLLDKHLVGTLAVEALVVDTVKA